MASLDCIWLLDIRKGLVLDTDEIIDTGDLDRLI